jgi:putative transcriptional regulator
VATLLTGRLLVATPGLRDENFARAVVLVLGHDADGALGVVLNRPSRTAVGAVLPGWEAAVGAPDVLFGGGPVGTSSAIGVGWCTGTVPAGFLPFEGQLGTIDLDADPLALAAGLRAVRIFAGYAGWSAGQLEREIDEGGWFVLEALPGDAFSADPEALYAQVLRRQQGRVALASTAPLDPSLN